MWNKNKEYVMDAIIFISVQTSFFMQGDRHNLSSLRPEKIFCEKCKHHCTEDFLTESHFGAKELKIPLRFHMIRPKVHLPKDYLTVHHLAKGHLL
jgi:hypothetical protein